MADLSNNDCKKLTKNGKVGKRRSKNSEEKHKKKRIKIKIKIAGLKYQNTNGNLIRPKQPGPDCKCRRQCFQKVPEDVRLKTFQRFNSMKTDNEQNAYLVGLMKQIDIKRKRVKFSTRRTCTFQYFIRVKGDETQVCQTAFKNIHAIKERKVRSLCKKIDDGVVFPTDACTGPSLPRSTRDAMHSGTKVLGALVVETDNILEVEIDPQEIILGI